MFGSRFRLLAVILVSHFLFCFSRVLIRKYVFHSCAAAHQFVLFVLCVDSGRGVCMPGEPTGVRQSQERPQATGWISAAAPGPGRPLHQESAVQQRPLILATWFFTESRVGCATTPSDPAAPFIKSPLCNNTLISWLLDSSRDGCTTPSDPGHRFFQETAVQHPLVLTAWFTKRTPVLSRAGCTTTRPSDPGCLVRHQSPLLQHFLILAAWFFVIGRLFNNTLSLASWFFSVASTKTPSDPGCLVFRHQSRLQKHPLILAA